MAYKDSLLDILYEIHKKRAYYEKWYGDAPEELLDTLLDDVAWLEKNLWEIIGPYYGY
jgi:hypothetical protein